MSCSRCDGKGAVRVDYHSGEPSDVGLCTCVIGTLLRGLIDRQPQLLEAHFKLPLERIWPVEVLVDDVNQAPKALDILLSAGKVDRAGLGGKSRRK